MQISRGRTFVTLMAVTLIVFQLALLVRAGARISDRQAQAFAPEAPHFQRTWARTDGPVASGATARTWIWGPEANTPVIPEEYAESPGTSRSVQYFDKSRMEITHPGGDPTSPWYVTNGLLVVELVTGQMQVGDASWDDREPADVNIAGDPDDHEAPTYAVLRQLRDAPPAADGATIVNRIDRSGTVRTDASFASYGVTAAWRVKVPGIDHQVAAPFWAFMNQHGPIEIDGQQVTAPLFESPFYATGYPIIEPYWTTVQVGGAPRDVLLQCFERRCLTYTPANDPAWQVEAGNVGQHYYRWRYADEPPAPTATVTTSTPTTPVPTCDHAYPDFCIPSPPPDLDCADFTERNFTALPPDPHGLDPDGDGIACEGSTVTATPTTTATQTSSPPATSTRTPTPANTRTPSPTATFTATGTSTGGSEAECLSTQEAAFLQLINTYRQQNGVPALTVSRKLNVASYRHSADMAQRDYFAHDTRLPLPPGQSGAAFTDRMHAAGYTSYSAAGENIAAGHSTAQAAFNAWKNSAGHNANMLNASFTQIGIGLAYDVDSTYGYYWTTDFANGSDSAPGC
jgi:uncharacterized protein YkwD